MSLSRVFIYLLIFFLLSASASVSAETSDAVAESSAPVETGSPASEIFDSEDTYTDDDFFDEEFEEYGDEEIRKPVSDPLYYWNISMFHFNDKFYFWLVKPTVRGYRFVMPTPARRGISNFYYNITFPVRVINCSLQGKFSRAGGEIGRFLLNTTAGVLGFGNPSRHFPELNPPPEDFGQTLGVYGIGNGFYVIWPFLGASTLRDTVGLAGDTYLDPVSHSPSVPVAISLSALKFANDTSFRIGTYEAIKEASVDPYSALRDAYLQLREEKVRQ